MSTSSTRGSTSSSSTRPIAATVSTSSTRSSTAVAASASACRPVAAPAVTLALTATDCCQYYITKAGDTCASIAARPGILGLNLVVLALLNPSLRCVGQGPQVGVAVCVLNIQLSIVGNLVSPGDSSTVTSSAIATPSPSQTVPQSFFIQAQNSGTIADGTSLMIQQAAEYFAGFNLNYGQSVFPFTFDPATGYLTSGLYILWATASYSPPSIKVAPVGFTGWVVPAWPLVCSIDGNLKVSCTANGDIYGKFYLINGMLSFSESLGIVPRQIDEMEYTDRLTANNDGQTELAIGNGAITSSIIVAPVDLYIIANEEEE